jgi:hypothetical protein
VSNDKDFGPLVRHVVAREINYQRNGKARPAP